MGARNAFRRFRRDEAGLVSVDWVVLTAALVGLGIVVIATVQTGVESLGDAIGTSLSEAEVAPVSEPAIE